MSFIIRATSVGDSSWKIRRYLTGKTGDAWLSLNPDEAFVYGEENFAKLACAALNANKTDERLQNWEFEVARYAKAEDPIPTLTDVVTVGEEKPQVTLPTDGKVVQTYREEYSLMTGDRSVVIRDHVTGEQVTIVTPDPGVTMLLIKVLDTCGVQHE